MEPKIRFKGFEDSWIGRKLTDVVSLYNGLTYTPNSIREKGTLVLRSSNVQDGEITLNDNVYVESSVVNSPNVEKGDIIVVVRNGSRALIGKHAQIKNVMKDTVIGAFMAGMRSENPEFTNALLGTPRFDYEVGINLGATINQITNATFHSMSFGFPSNKEQKAIGKYFTSLDSQISASTSRLASLKQMKAASLQAMFPQEGETVPKIRFKGFEGEWTWLKLGDISEQVKRKAPINSTAPVMMISALNGFINQSEKYSDNNAGSSLANYTLLKKGELSYNHGYSKTRNFGSCFNLLVEEARIPFVYHSFRLTNDNDSFYAYYLNSGTKDKDLKRLVSSTARMDGLLNISFKNYMELSVPHPSLAEQQAIANYFTSLDRQISLQSQRLEKLKQIKSACLDKMFV